MSQRLSDPTKFVWCVLVLSSGPAWIPVSCNHAVHSSEKIPSTIETQAKFFQDFFSVQLSPYKIEFGHVCEDPNTWEQRYEKKDFKNHRDMGKVRWGDTKGGYGEHYWDLNHAGHAGNQENDDNYDDVSSNEELQDYPEPAEQSDKSEAEVYNPNASYYEKSARPKRENSKLDLQSLKGERNDEIERRSIQKLSNMDETMLKRDNINTKDNFGGNLMKTNLKAKSLKQLYEQYLDEISQTSEKNDIILVVDNKVKGDYDDEDFERFKPYQVDAERKHYRRLIGSAHDPKLLLESFTGHVIDEPTRQAYVLQPVNLNNKYS